MRFSLFLTALTAACASASVIETRGLGDFPSTSYSSTIPRSNTRSDPVLSPLKSALKAA